MKNNSSVLKRIGKIILIVLCALLLVVLAAQLVTTLIFFDFFKDAEKEYRIPGLSDGLVPQGYTYLPDQQFYLQCGYMTDGESASRIYIISKSEPSKAYYVELLTEDGAPYTGHTGGIAVSGNFVWLANDGEGEDNCVWVLSLYDLLRKEAGEGIRLTLSFRPETRAAYCFVEDNRLWVGEFYRPVDYPTKESHTFTVAGGTQNHALIASYPLDATADLGIVEGPPTALISVTNHVQGFARDEYGHFILSTSYGLSKSHFLFYDNVMNGEIDAYLDVNGTSVPVWFLDEEVLMRDLECPPMSEEIVIQDGRIYYLTESACNKYIFGNFIRGRHVYSIPLEQ